jgi:hypothetical protein
MAEKFLSDQPSALVKPCTHARSICSHKFLDFSPFISNLLPFALMRHVFLVFC